MIDIEEFNKLRAEGDLKVCDWVKPSNPVLLCCDGRNGWRFKSIIIQETEKAVKLFYIDYYGDHNGETWVSKRCFESASAYLAAEDARAARRQAAFEAGAAAYDKLVAWCKEHGVKGVRTGMRKATIMARIKDAGLAYGD